MSIFQEDISLICEVIKTPVDDYTSIGIKIGDTVVISPTDYKKEVINLYLGQGHGYTFNKDELEVVSISKRIIITDKNEVLKELAIL